MPRAARKGRAAAWLSERNSRNSFRLRRTNSKYWALSDGGSTEFPKFPRATCRDLPLSSRVCSSGQKSSNPLASSGRHRPQRCRQTDPKAGEVVVYVQAACLRGDRPKAIAVVCKRLSNSPSTRKDFLDPDLPHETNPPRPTRRAYLPFVGIFPRRESSSHHRQHHRRSPGRYAAATRASEARVHRCL